MKLKISLFAIALFLLAFHVQAVDIKPIPHEPSLFQRIGAFFNGCPFHYTCFQQRFGTTVTTILGSDTLSASRTTINNNFTALNNGKIENSTTSVNSIVTLSGLTTASALATIGTITSGTWHGSLLEVAYGGTASTSLSSNQVILGNTTSGFKTVTGWGNSGQFLTSNGGTAAPTWQSASVDTSLYYTWSGFHTFASTSGNFIVNSASSTIRRLSVDFGTTTQATSTYLFATNASSTNLSVTSCSHCINPSIVSNTSGACATGAGGTCTITATCSGSQKVLGGGGIQSTTDGAVVPYQSYPDSASSWTYSTTNSGASSAHTITAYAICANP